MILFKCYECDAEFTEPKIIFDNVPYGSEIVKGPAMACCPFCGGPFDEPKVCEICGDSYIESKHDGACNSCIGIIESRFSQLLKSNFTPFEISILNTVYDGRNLE